MSGGQMDGDSARRGAAAAPAGPDAAAEGADTVTNNGAPAAAPRNGELWRAQHHAFVLKFLTGLRLGFGGRLHFVSLSAP